MSKEEEKICYRKLFNLGKLPIDLILNKFWQLEAT